MEIKIKILDPTLLTKTAAKTAIPKRKGITSKQTKMLAISNRDTFTMLGTAAIGLSVVLTSAFAKANNMGPSNGSGTETELKTSGNDHVQHTIPLINISPHAMCLSYAQFYTDNKRFYSCMLVQVLL